MMVTVHVCVSRRSMRPAQYAHVILTDIIVIHVPMAFIDWAAIIVWLIEHKWNLKWSSVATVLSDCGESPYECETMV